MSVVKLHQEGTLQLTTETTKTVTITAVDRTKAFLVYSSRNNDGSPGNVMMTGQLTADTTITFVRKANGGTVDIQWFVVEFESGVVVQRGTLTDRSSPPITVTLGTEKDETKSFLIFSYHTSGSIVAHDDFWQGRLVDNDADNNVEEIEFDGSLGTFGSLEWQVVTYEACKVQRGELAFGSGDTSLTAALTAVDRDKAWLLCCGFTYPTSSKAQFDQSFFKGLINTTTQLTFSKDRSGVVQSLSWEVVEFTDDTTVQEIAVDFGTTGTVEDDTITAVDLSTAIVTASGFMYMLGLTDYSADDFIHQAGGTLDLSSTTNLKTTRSLTGSKTANLIAYVVDFATAAETHIEGLDAAAVGAASDTLSYTVSSGSDRALIVGVSWESGTPSNKPTAVTYGGQAMIQIENVEAGSTTLVGASLWYILDAGIAAASGTTISVTFPSSPGIKIIHARSYINVEQDGGATTVPASATATTPNTTPNPQILDLTEVDTGLVVGFNASGNPGNMSWNSGMTELTDLESGSSFSSMADRLSITSSNVDIEPTCSSQNRAAGVSASFAVQPEFVLTLRTIVASATAVAVALQAHIHPFAMVASATAVGVFADEISRFRTLAAVVSATVVMNKVRAFCRNLVGTTLATPVLTRGLDLHLTLTSSASGDAVMPTPVKTGIATLTAAATGVVTNLVGPIFVRVLSASSTAIVVMSDLVSFFQTLAATASGNAGLSRLNSFFRTLAASGTGVAVIIAGHIHLLTISATALATATIARLSVQGANLVATATGVAADFTFHFTTARTLVATAVGAPVLNKFLDLKRRLAVQAHTVAQTLADGILVGVFKAPAGWSQLVRNKVSKLFIIRR